MCIRDSIYFTLPENNQQGDATGITTTTEELNKDTATPTSQASSDEIIDFMVDDLAASETAAAEANIESTSPSSQSEAATSLNTDF